MMIHLKLGHAYAEAHCTCLGLKILWQLRNRTARIASYTTGVAFFISLRIHYMHVGIKIGWDLIFVHVMGAPKILVYTVCHVTCTVVGAFCVVCELVQYVQSRHAAYREYIFPKQQVGVQNTNIWTVHHEICGDVQRPFGNACSCTILLTKELTLMHLKNLIQWICPLTFRQ